MRFSARFTLLSFVLALVAASASAQPEKSLDPEELLARAHRAFDLRAQGAAAFSLKANVSITVMPKDAPRGEWTLSWESPGRWHERFFVPGFTRRRASGPDGLWELAEPDRSFPLVSSLSAALDPLQFLSLGRGDRITAAARVRGGAGAVRIDIDRSLRHEAPVSVFVNEITGFLVAVERMDVANRFEYLDHVRVGKRYFPKTIRVRRGGAVHAIVTVEDSAAALSLSAERLVRPRAARSLMSGRCLQREMPILLEAMAAVFPPEFEKEGVEGVVLLELEVDTDGRVSRVKVLRSDHFKLTEPVATAARARVYRAGRCDGRAVVAHVRMGVAHPQPTKNRAGRRGRREGVPNDGSDPLAGKR